MNENEKLENQGKLEEMAAEECADLEESSKEKRKFGIGGLIVGGVMLVGGAIAYISAKKRKNKAKEETEDDFDDLDDETVEDADFKEVDDKPEKSSEKSEKE